MVLADLEIIPAGGKVMIHLTNKAGHVLPGEALRAVILDVKIYDSGASVIHHNQIFHSISSGEDGSDNRIQPGETRQFAYEIGEKERIEAKLLYRLLPTTAETKWVTMAEASAPSQ